LFFQDNDTLDAPCEVFRLLGAGGGAAEAVRGDATVKPNATAAASSASPNRFADFVFISWSIRLGRRERNRSFTVEKCGEKRLAVLADFE